jgi:hypothetical protein
MGRPLVMASVEPGREPENQSPEDKTDMTEQSPIPGFAGQQNAATAFIGTMLNSGAQRRQEAVVDAQRLVAQLQAVSSAAEMLKVQQEWMGGAFQRMNADAIAYQAPAMQLIEKSRHWVGQSVET